MLVWDEKTQHIPTDSCVDPINTRAKYTFSIKEKGTKRLVLCSFNEINSPVSNKLSRSLVVTPEPHLYLSVILQRMLIGSMAVRLATNTKPALGKTDLFNQMIK